MYDLVKQGLKLWGEYMRLPPIGNDMCRGYPSQTSIADIGRRQKKSRSEELEDYNKFYAPKRYTGPSACPKCGDKMNGPKCSQCGYEDDSTRFKTYKAITGRETRQVTPRSSKPGATVERFIQIMDTLKDDPGTFRFYQLAWLKYKEEREVSDICDALNLGETGYRGMLKELYAVVYGHLQSKDLKRTG